MTIDEALKYYRDGYQDWIRHVRTPTIRKCGKNFSKNALHIPELEKAEQVVQQAVLKVARRAERIDATQNPRGYILSILDCAVMDWARRIGMEEDRILPPKGPTLPEEPVERTELDMRLRKALRKARSRMDSLERTVLLAWLDAEGDRPEGTLLFLAAWMGTGKAITRSDQNKYDGTLHEARKKICRELIREFAPDHSHECPPAQEEFDPKDWYWFLGDVFRLVVVHVGWEAVRDMMYEIFG